VSDPIPLAIADLLAVRRWHLLRGSNWGKHPDGTLVFYGTGPTGPTTPTAEERQFAADLVSATQRSTDADMQRTIEDFIADRRRHGGTPFAAGDGDDPFDDVSFDAKPARPDAKRIVAFVWEREFAREAAALMMARGTHG